MTIRSEGWAFFDAIVDKAAHRRTSPWHRRSDQSLVYQSDFDTLARLLAVPIHLNANSQSGVPALALDVWAAYEFRRAGFDSDAIWPRSRAPRVLTPEVASLVAAMPRDLRVELTRRIEAGTGMKGVVGANATVLGKNYVKQVDVGMSSWRTGPELLVSTKRMDSSFGKNAANRVEESYGDAKNLRLRHPRAALGFVYALRSTALIQEPDKADWLRDLLAKLGREDDAYDAVALIIPEWDSGSLSDRDDTESGEDNAFVAAGLEESPSDQDDMITDHLDLLPGDLDREIASLPAVGIRHDAIPEELHPNRFYEVIIRKVLANSPINFHVEARRILAAAESDSATDL